MVLSTDWSCQGCPLEAVPLGLASRAGTTPSCAGEGWGKERWSKRQSWVNEVFITQHGTSHTHNLGQDTGASELATVGDEMQGGPC